MCVCVCVNLFAYTRDDHSQAGATCIAKEDHEQEVYVCVCVRVQGSARTAEHRAVSLGGR